MLSYSLKDPLSPLQNSYVKDVENSEKILKIKSPIKEGFDIDADLKIRNDFNLLLKAVEEVLHAILGDADRTSLNDHTRDISDHISGFVAHKLQISCESCCLIDSKATGNS